MKSSSTFSAIKVECVTRQVQEGLVVSSSPVLIAHLSHQDREAVLELPGEVLNVNGRRVELKFTWEK